MDIPTVKWATGAHIQLHKCYGSSVFMSALFPLQNFNTLLTQCWLLLHWRCRLTVLLTNCPLGVSEGYQQQRAILSNQNMFGSIFKVVLEYPHLNIVIFLRPPRTDMFNKPICQQPGQGLFLILDIPQERNDLYWCAQAPGTWRRRARRQYILLLLLLLLQPPLNKEGTVPEGGRWQVWWGREGKVAYTQSGLDILKKAGVW